MILVFHSRKKQCLASRSLYRGAEIKEFAVVFVERFFWKASLKPEVAAVFYHLAVSHSVRSNDLETSFSFIMFNSDQHVNMHQKRRDCFSYFYRL